MKFVIIAQTRQLPKNSKMLITYDDKKILLANINEAYYALDNTCPHMGGSLVNGNLDGFNIVCPRHGSVFDLRTGKVVTKGKLFLLKVKVSDLHQYPVKVEGTDIMIGID